MPLTRRCASAVLAACAASTVFAAHDEAIHLRQGFGGLAPAALVQHVVVIFQENVSFDHYFATYPHARICQRRRTTPLPGTPWSPASRVSPDEESELHESG
jgi:phospholipase C